MSRRPRVVYLDHCAQMSGGEIALVRLLEALDGRVDAEVILGEDGPIAPLLRDAGAQVTVLPMGGDVQGVRKDAVTLGGIPRGVLLGTGRYVARLTRELRSRRPDLVHTNSLKSALYGATAARAALLPVLWHIRDRISDDYLPGPAVGLVRGLSRVLPSAVVVNSLATAATLPGPSRVVYDIVAGRPGARPRVDRPDRPLVVGMVGRLAPWKGQDVFLRAVAAQRGGRAVQARLIGSAMFGEEEYAASLHRLADDLGITERVEFRGYREDVWAELDELDLLVHASVTPEPFGQVVIEGMAAGLPVIAADAGGPSEIVTSGVDGLLVPPGDVAALGRAIESLADDPGQRHRLAAAGLRRSTAYDPQTAADTMTAIYRELSGRRLSGS